MIPGIDPKIDIAFKKVFGSESWTDLTASLINAVLEPPPQQRLVAVELLNKRLVDVKPLISATLPYRDAGKAFALAADRSQAMKVLLNFD